MVDSFTVPASPSNLRDFVRCGFCPNMCWYCVALLLFTDNIITPSWSD